MPSLRILAPTSAAIALERIGAELGRLAQRLARVEVAIGRVVHDAGAASAELVVDLQEVDLARQEAEALAQVVLGVSRALPRAARVNLDDATAGLKLADLAARLEGAARAQPQACEAVLFE